MGKQDDRFSGSTTTFLDEDSSQIGETAIEIGELAGVTAPTGELQKTIDVRIPSDARKAGALTDISSSAISTVYIDPGKLSPSEIEPHLRMGAVNVGDRFEHVIHPGDVIAGQSAVVTEMVRLDHGRPLNAVSLMLPSSGRFSSQIEALKREGFSVVLLSLNSPDDHVRYERSTLSQLSSFLYDDVSLVVEIDANTPDARIILVDEIGEKTTRIRDVKNGTSVRVYNDALEEMLRGRLDIVQVRS